MRLGNLAGRAVLIAVDGDRAGAVDVEAASGRLFGPDLPSVYDRWQSFRAWAGTVDLSGAVPVPIDRLGPPSPVPRQIFGIGLNYRSHAAEAGLDVPDTPVVFTKFASCLTGPVSEVALPAGALVDWEVELVAVIGRTARHVPASRAWDHVAGVTVGQDISDRRAQNAGVNPQYSLAKSSPGFGPTGPWLVTADEFARRDDIELWCRLNGEQVQHASTADLVFSVPALVAYLSSLVTLLPGDLVFTGTPGGVALGRDPQRWLQPGDEVVSGVAGIGELRQRFVAGRAADVPPNR
jgi:2,4-didehydro-3-deoxy-L-rhamnonate hydrolase